MVSDCNRYVIGMPTVALLFQVRKDWMLPGVNHVTLDCLLLIASFTWISLLKMLQWLIDFSVENIFFCFNANLFEFVAWLLRGRTI